MDSPLLHLAAAAGQVDCVVLLLQRGAPVDGVDARGRTAM
ncbi:MAG: ankyrin repeat domain-containing protein, partial [Alcanivorax sp.]